LIWISRKL